MKRKLVYGLAFVFLLMAYGLLLTADSLAQEAKVVGVTGDVQVKKAGKEAWVKAKEGMPIGNGDVIKTRDNSRAFLTFDEKVNKAVSIEELTEITVRELRPPKMQVELPAGDLFSKIDKLEKGSTFEIRTPTAVAGVKGTGWSTSFRNQEARIAVFEGGVNFAGRDFAEGDTGALRMGELVLGRLTDTDRRSWDSFRDEVRELREVETREKEKEGPAVPPAAERALEQIERTTERQTETVTDTRFEDTLQSERIEKREEPKTSTRGYDGYNP